MSELMIPEANEAGIAISSWWKLIFLPVRFQSAELSLSYQAFSCASVQTYSVVSYLVPDTETKSWMIRYMMCDRGEGKGGMCTPADHRGRAIGPCRSHLTPHMGPTHRHPTKKATLR